MLLFIINSNCVLNLVTYLFMVLQNTLVIVDFIKSFLLLVNKQVANAGANSRFCENFEKNWKKFGP